MTGKGLKGTDASSAIADKSKIYIGKVDPRYMIHCLRTDFKEKHYVYFLCFLSAVP